MKPIIQTKIFVAKGKAPAEAHVMIHANPTLSSARQVQDIFASLDHLSSESLQGYVPVFMRFFLSDSFNLTPSSVPVLRPGPALSLSSNSHLSTAPR